VVQTPLSLVASADSNWEKIGGANFLLTKRRDCGIFISDNRQKREIIEMRFSEIFKTLEKNGYYIFSLDDLSLFYPDESRANLAKLVYRWRKKGWIRSLKRGLYELCYPDEIAIPDVYIANRLYGPSYVSLETALSHYGILPEVSMAVTSITTKATRRFKNVHGFFVYRSVKPEAYSGYLIERHRNFEVLFADPEKALVDYLYFRRRDFGSTLAIAELRMDASAIRDLSKRKLNRFAKQYKIELEALYAQL
jgi:predicted transcriptional regulator of viral defense system